MIRYILLNIRLVVSLSRLTRNFLPKQTILEYNCVWKRNRTLEKSFHTYSRDFFLLVLFLFILDSRSVLNLTTGLRQFRRGSETFESSPTWHRTEPTGVFSYPPSWVSSRVLLYRGHLDRTLSRDKHTYSS